MDIFAGQPIRVGEQDPIEFREGDSIAQAIQAGASQLRATVAIIAEDILGCQRPALGLDIGPQALELLLNGLCLGLPLGGHTHIDSYSHDAPPAWLDGQPQTRGPKSVGRYCSIAEGTGRRDPNELDHREPRGTDGGCSIDVSWVPPRREVSSAGYPETSGAVGRERSGRRHQLRWRRPARVIQNLSFVIVPSNIRSEP